MDKISLAQLAADCTAIVERVVRTGEAVSIVRDGKAIAQIVPASLSAKERHELEAAAGMLDLDDDVVDAEEIVAMERANREWDALNSAIDRDLGAAKRGPARKKKPAKEAAGAPSPKKRKASAETAPKSKSAAKTPGRRG